jgi:hypothetical protein
MKIPQNIHALIMFIAFQLSVFNFIAGVAAADEGISFHCTLGLHGMVMAEANLRLSADGSKLYYALSVHHVEGITMAHLHLGKINEIRTPIAWLYPPSPPPKLIPGFFTGILAEGTITRDDLMGHMRGKPLSVLVEEIKAGNVFVNIHTLSHAHGDICGPVYLKED